MAVTIDIATAIRAALASTVGSLAPVYAMGVRTDVDGDRKSHV